MIIGVACRSSGPHNDVATHPSSAVDRASATRWIARHGAQVALAVERGQKLRGGPGRRPRDRSTHEGPGRLAGELGAVFRTGSSPSTTATYAASASAIAAEHRVVALFAHRGEQLRRWPLRVAMKHEQQRRLHPPGSSHDLDQRCEGHLVCLLHGVEHEFALANSSRWPTVRAPTNSSTNGRVSTNGPARRPMAPRANSSRADQQPARQRSRGHQPLACRPQLARRPTARAPANGSAPSLAPTNRSRAINVGPRRASGGSPAIPGRCDTRCFGPTCRNSFMQRLPQPVPKRLH